MWRLEMMRAGVRIPNRLLAAVLALLAIVLFGPPAAAHVFQTSEAQVFFDRTGQRYGLKLILNLEAIIAGIDPEVKDTSESPKATEYNRLRALPPDQLRDEFSRFQNRLVEGTHILLDGKPAPVKIVSLEFQPVGDMSRARRTPVVMEGSMPPGTQTFTFQWDPSFGKVSIRTMGIRSRTMHLEVVERGQQSQPLVIDNLKARTVTDMVIDFVKIGFTHILPKGTDHILFVVGIFLLSTKLRPILTQVTSFTVAHTATLGLGTLGYVNLPSSIVEPLIAASIVYVAVENILRPTLSPWRPVVVFCFGLLHGLGFAGILKEFGIPEGDFLAGLLSFNVGVELGQLTVIALCYLLVGIWFGNKPWYRQRIVIPGSLLIAAIGAFWFVQRVAGGA